jgi:transposase-like protein
MRFWPTYCPYAACPSRTEGRFQASPWGTFLRKCDGRPAQRFRCSSCLRTFSSQTFRLDYRLQRPRLHLDLWPLFISKVTHRQAARVLDCTRKSVAHRLDLLGQHCRQFHRARLDERPGGLCGGPYQLDELETYEHRRRLQPLTVPVLIHRRSYFVVHAQVASLPCRGGLRAAERRRKERLEAQFGVRRSGSRRAVEDCFERLVPFLGRASGQIVETDCKSTYPGCIQRALGQRIQHQRTPSKLKRDRANPLFPINHTLAQMRDGLSRLVRRTWAASKQAERLAHHLWIWICWRNYVRGVTNWARSTTPGMIVGATRRPLERDELLRWHVRARR